MLVVMTVIETGITCLLKCVLMLIFFCRCRVECCKNLVFLLLFFLSIDVKAIKKNCQCTAGLVGGAFVISVLSGVVHIQAIPSNLWKKFMNNISPRSKMK